MPPARRPTEAPLTILVIDDDADARRMYSQHLRLKGCVVFTAADGRSGIDKSTNLTPDIVLLDLAMPRVDGWTVLRHLRESSWTAKIPIVVVSAMDHARDRGLSVGMRCISVETVYAGGRVAAADCHAALANGAR